jgi:hypothetical protein
LSALRILTSSRAVFLSGSLYADRLEPLRIMPPGRGRR